MRIPLQLLLRIPALALLGMPLASAAQTPAEVTGLKWCAGSKACLMWDTVPAASTYTLYRGDETTLPGLLSSADDSCQRVNFYVPTTGDSLSATPPSGHLHWYLITAVNVNGEGPAGNATTGPEIQNPTGECDPAGMPCLQACVRTFPPDPFSTGGPRIIPGVGCGCNDDSDCSDWGFACSRRHCSNNRCIEVGALADFTFPAPAWSR